MTELMERLERANPIPSGEAVTPEERRDADALLERIVAEPASKPAPQRRARPPLRPRRLALAGALGAALVAAAIVAVDLIDADRGPDGILEQAVAAVSQDDAIYAIAHRERHVTRPLEGRGRVQRDSAFRRYWLWAGGRRSRFLDYRLRPNGEPGRLMTESVSDGSGLSWWNADTNEIIVLDRSGEPEDPQSPPEDDDYPGVNPFLEPGAQLRALVDDGSLRVAGRTRLRGRSAYVLVSGRLSNPSPGIESERVTYLVDSRTFLPLALRMRVVADLVHGRELMTTRVDYLRYERLPVTDANKALLRMSPHPGADRTG
jgi:hypothetical protein